MCHKLVQTAVGRLRLAAALAGEEDPTGQSARALGSIRILADVCAPRPWGGNDQSSVSPRCIFRWVFFCNEIFQPGFQGAFQICHLHYFPNSRLRRGWHFRDPYLIQKPAQLVSSCRTRVLFSENCRLTIGLGTERWRHPNPTFLPTHLRVQFPL